MPNFTPGPWLVKETRTDRVRISVIGPDFEICRHYQVGPRDEERANARLIAAAPDMLETLKAVGRTLGERPDDDELFALFSRVINTIMKAEVS